ncbi:MAG: HDIG domain-containing protein [Candidatus Omnitrophica bacterium]|nr:HDIG domain-containing protein [Candidatus Omnitrophota bacterium]
MNMIIVENKKSKGIFSGYIIGLVFFALFIFFCYKIDFPLSIPLLFFVVGIYLNYFHKATVKLFLNLGLLLVILMFVTDSVLHYTDLSGYFVPVAGFSMLSILLFNDIQLTFLLTLLSSVTASLILGGDFNMMVIFLVGGLTGATVVKDARNRDHLIGAGIMVSAVSAVSLFIVGDGSHQFLKSDFLVNKLYPLVANGFISAALVAATLKIFETLFGVLTNYSLSELSDSNQPLLKRLIMEAPGTYQHCLVVGNLAEAASEEIGANPLLARVGAYYHDIGKIVKADYFAENQFKTPENKHDGIEPTMSRLVILNHVKEGEELARKYKLNLRLMDFISEHHGTSLVHFFYQRALETAESGEVVKETDFRYPGPKPQSPETAICMLADSVEGAIRSVEDPTPARIEETVKKVVNNKFIDGQLDECTLTLQQIDKISKTFTRILSAMHHARVKYPEKKIDDRR